MDDHNLISPTCDIDFRVFVHGSQGGRRYMEDSFTVSYATHSPAHQASNHHPSDNSTAKSISNLLSLRSANPDSSNSSHLLTNNNDNLFFESHLSYVFAGIFDGHGGEQASKFTKKVLLSNITSSKDFWSGQDDLILKSIKEGFIATHLAMLHEVEKWPCTPAGLPSTSGTTSSVCFIMNNKVYTGHVGDSRIVLGRKNKETGMWIPHALTQDHKPESPEERERIEKAGGEVSKTSRSGAERVVWFRPKQGHKGPVRRSTSFEKVPFLAVARSLGDLWSYNPDTGCYAVSPEPDVSVVPLNLHEDKCLILASDGLWNMLMDYESVRMVQELEESDQVRQLLLNSLGPELATSLKNPSEALVEFAIRKWNKNLLRADNTSAITILLSPRNDSNCCISHDKCKNSWTPGKQVIVPNLENGPRTFELSVNHDQFYLDKTHVAATCTASHRAKVVSDISHTIATATCHLSSISSLSNTSSPLAVTVDNLSTDSNKLSIHSHVSANGEQDEISCNSMAMKTRTTPDFTVYFELDEDCISDSADEAGLRMHKACLVLEPLVDAIYPASNQNVPKESIANPLNSNRAGEIPARPSVANAGPSTNLSSSSSSNNANDDEMNLQILPRVSPLTENVMKVPKSPGSVISNQLEKIHMVTRSAVKKRRQNKWYMNTANLPQNEHHLQLTNRPKRLRSATKYSRAGLGLTRSICKAFTNVSKSRTHKTRQGSLK